MKKNNRGYFGIGIWNNKSEVNYGTLFRSANCFGADFLFLIGRRFKKLNSDTMRSERHIPVFEYKDFENFFNATPYGSEVVAVEIVSKAQSLNSFQHPRRAIYLLGPEDGSLPTEIIDKCHCVISIPTQQCLNVAMAGTVVLYDRQLKMIGDIDA